jgi:hypothetical protein
MRKIVVICGGREATNRINFEKFLNECTEGMTHPIIRHGGARGTDEMAHAWARKKGHDIETHLADWARFGKKAGPIRNKKMIEGAHLVCANWNCKSKGTKNTILLAKIAGIQYEILTY